MTGSTDFFEEVESLPDPRARERFDRLVGLDEVKARLIKEARLLIEPGLLESWSKEHHGKVIAATEAFDERIPLFVFAGDVGTGKTVLAETFGDPVAREADLDILLFKLSLRARGSGSVGEMTQLISSAFDYVKQEVPPPKEGKRSDIAGILLIDEADAVAQSRELSQMHHEDRAGVNALIRGVDSVAAERRPVITVMCSNRLSAIDPAVQRRAADIVEFSRPDTEQRAAVLSRAFADAGLTDKEIEKLAKATGPAPGRDYGYTYSDLTTRLIPNAVLSAVPEEPLTYNKVAQVLEETPPTVPFAADEPH